jgi:hypothetical protein
MAKGWLDNYGVKENENNSSVSLPEGFVGMGNNIKGRNYSPAWGGQFQMGGSIPGAVGFTYARTQSPAPSNGKYAKKTKASAQDGAKLDMHGSPITAIEKHRYDIDRSYYNPRTNQMILGADYAASDNKDKMIAHENYHAKQHSEGRDNFDIGHDTENRQWAEMQKRPQMMSTPEVWNNFYNRKAIESDMAISRITERLPESQFFRDAAGDIIYNKIVDPIQYDIPYSFEGEAQFYENTGKEFKNGGWLNKYDVAQDGVQTWKKQQELLKKEKAGKLKALLENPPVFKKKTFEEKVKENVKEKPRAVVKESTAVKNYNNADKFSKVARNKTDKEIADERKAIRKKSDANVLNQYSTEILKGDNWTRQNLSDAALGLESKFRVSDEPNFFDDYLNPFNMVGNMASNLGQAPLQAEQTDSYMPYVTAIGAPLTVGALAGLGANSNSQFVNNLVNPLAGLENSALRTLPKAKSFKDALGTFRGIPTERSLPRLSPEELKTFRQVQEIGRMRATNKPISEQYRYALDQNIPEEHLQKMFRRGRQEIESILPNELEAQALREANPVPISERFNLDRAPRRPRSGNADDQLTEMFNDMPESLRSRIQAADNARASAQVPTSLDDIFNQLDAGTHSSQRAPRVSSTSDRAIDAMNSSRSEDIARAMERDRLRQMMGRWDDELNTAAPESITNPVTSDSDDYLDFIEPDTSGPPQMPYDKERDYLQRYLSNQTNRVEDYANRTLYPKIEQFGDTADRIRKSQRAKFQNKLDNYISEYPYYQGPIMENVPSLSLSSSGSLKNVSNKVDNAIGSGMSSGDVFTGSLNTSHSSYLPQLKRIFKYNEGAPQFFGYKPMNPMGFLSDFNYSADDIAKYLNTEIDQQIKRGILPDNVLRPFSTNNPKLRYQSVQLPHYGIQQFKEGGVIKDDLGQWAHPGEITEINSNDITMEGVPYDVLGISDEGDVQLMKPGKNYKFKGKKVTEFPMAKNGLRQEQKSLQNLDNLTNFTNYNKPQPGGWLNKYN